MSYYFYLARCSYNSLYAGYCKDLTQREEAHNTGKGAKYKRSHGPVKIVYSEKFDTLSEALRREAEIKKWKKAQKEELIDS